MHKLGVAKRFAGSQCASVALRVAGKSQNETISLPFFSGDAGFCRSFK